jgi:hypothetical protein
MSGFIQYPVFVPHATARQTPKDVRDLCHQAKLPSFLGVLARHRPEPSPLKRALDECSLAMDFPSMGRTARSYGF